MVVVWVVVVVVAEGVFEVGLEGGASCLGDVKKEEEGWWSSRESKGVVQDVF